VREGISKSRSRRGGGSVVKNGRKLTRDLADRQSPSTSADPVSDYRTVSYTHHPLVQFFALLRWHSTRWIVPARPRRPSLREDKCGLVEKVDRLAAAGLVEAPDVARPLAGGCQPAPTPGGRNRSLGTSELPRPAIGPDGGSRDPPAGSRYPTDVEDLQSCRCDDAGRPRSPFRPCDAIHAILPSGLCSRGRVRCRRARRRSLRRRGRRPGNATAGWRGRSWCAACRRARSGLGLGNGVHRDRRARFHIVPGIGEVDAATRACGTRAEPHVLPIGRLRAGDEEKAAIVPAEIRRVQVGAIARVVVGPEHTGMRAADCDPRALGVTGDSRTPPFGWRSRPARRVMRSRAWPTRESACSSSGKGR